METNQSYDPAEALRDAQAARDRVADRAKAPGYYYPVLGLAVAVLIATQTVGGTLAAAASGICALVCGLLAAKYRETTGLWVTYGGTGRSARLLWAGFGVGVLALFAAAMWVQLTHRPGWWGLPLGVVAFVMCVAVGRYLEPRLREGIRQGTVTPTRVR